ncbi:MAG: hypothetical protein R3A79_00895 [Nannocystaceae bacterium]
MARRSNLATLRDMGALSLVTLLLGAGRELLIARDLQASGDADIFFRGLVAVATVRACALAVYRARWIPADAALPTRALLAAGARSASLLGVVGILALAPLIGPRDLLRAAAEPSQALALAALAIAAFIAAWAGHLRALAERRGRELRGFGVDWGLALGTIAGTLLLDGHGALGPSVGLLAGLAVGAAMLWPARPRVRATATADAEPVPHDIPVAAPPGDRRPLWLLLDALLYGNLGVVDSLFSHLLIAGSLAVLSYAGLFVNSALMLLTGAVTVVALRVAAASGAAAGPSMRRWSLLGGAAVTLGLLVIGLALGWAPVVELFARLLGWDLAGSVRPVVLWSLPYAFLRLANTIGRQRRLVHGELRGVVAWDLAGIAARSLLLALTIAELGLVAFPIAAAAAEALQLGVWWRGARPA